MNGFFRARVINALHTEIGFTIAFTAIQPCSKRGATIRLGAAVATALALVASFAITPTRADAATPGLNLSQSFGADAVETDSARSTVLDGPAGAGNEAPQNHFDLAQSAIGASKNYATTFEPGITVSPSPSSATLTKSGLAVKVTAEGAITDVTVLSNGARIMSQLEEGESDATFTVELPANTSLESDNHGFLIVGDAGGTKLVLGAIETPWAVDADGTMLPTHYTLNGTQLTQHVQTEGATYPIVADPTITFGLWNASDGPGTYWNMTGAQAKTLAAATSAVFALSVAGGCVAAGKIPSVGFIVQGVCGFVGVPSLQSMWSGIMSIIANTNMNNSACYQIKILPAGQGFFNVDSANCA